MILSSKRMGRPYGEAPGDTYGPWDEVQPTTAAVPSGAPCAFRETCSEVQ